MIFPRKPMISHAIHPAESFTASNWVTSGRCTFTATGLPGTGPAMKLWELRKITVSWGNRWFIPLFFFGIQPSQVDFHRRSSKKLAMFIDFPELNNQKGVPSPMDVASQAAVHGCLVHLTSGGARRGCNLANWDQCWREERIGNMFENDTYVHIYIYIYTYI